MLEIKDFCEKLGSTSPTPGGGAAAGICLSMGAACAEKAARFSSLTEEHQEFIKSFVQIRQKGLKSSEEDQKVFLNWQEARKLPKNNENEKIIRQKKIDFFASECARVPLEICENALKLSGVIQDFIPYCNKWLISDASVGASLSRAAFESSIINININIPYIKNRDFLKNINNFMDNKVELFYKITEGIIFLKNVSIFKKSE